MRLGEYLPKKINTSLTPRLTEGFDKMIGGDSKTRSARWSVHRICQRWKCPQQLINSTRLQDIGQRQKIAEM